eukprot:ANDGO_04146.mRNA.1 Catalase isozyme 2
MNPEYVTPRDRQDGPVFSDINGSPVWNVMQPLTVGNRGPILLEDHLLVSRLAAFHREKIPERVVHAVGASAKGYFECTADVSDRTAADFLRAPGTKTPVVVRFSTVVHPRGSPETLRDPRGFAVKFYTREGNYDIVGNNFPVFFIRDGMLFPSMVHAFKPNPRNNLQEFWRVWDFFSALGPQHLHMMTFLQDDCGIPQDYRHMEGFGVHTYHWITRDGRETLVKYHWVPKQGVRNLLEDQAIVVGGTNHQHAQLDLHEAIARGDFPEWTLRMQYMDPSLAESLEFDPFDVTKTWPEDRFPLYTVGRLVLNQNTEFHAENEQLAFCPSNIVPGVALSQDKLLQTRVFSYLDTQRHRLGNNFNLLPVNAPRCVFRNPIYDGQGTFVLREKEVNYFPSRFDPTRHAEQKTPLVAQGMYGKKVKAPITKVDDFSQARARYLTFDAERRERFFKRILGTLAHPKCSTECRKIIVSHFEQMDQTLGLKLKKALNL